MRCNNDQCSSFLPHNDHKVILAELLVPFFPTIVGGAGEFRVMHRFVYFRNCNSSLSYFLPYVVGKENVHAYLAYSITLVSLITLILISPGYCMSFSILSAMLYRHIFPEMPILTKKRVGPLAAKG